MTDKELDKDAARRLVIIRHAQEVIGDWPRASACRSGGTIVPPVGVTVVSLGARSELARGRPPERDIEVHEFAMLDDGRRLTLRQRRGFSTSATH